MKVCEKVIMGFEDDADDKILKKFTINKMG